MEVPTAWSGIFDKDFFCLQKHRQHISYIYICIYIWGFLKWWVSPTNPWVFLLKMIILGWRLGVPPFKETPIYIYLSLYPSCIQWLTHTDRTWAQKSARTSAFRPRTWVKQGSWVIIIWARVDQFLTLGMVIPPLIGNPYNGYRKPPMDPRVDDFPSPYLKEDPSLEPIITWQQSK